LQRIGQDHWDRKFALIIDHFLARRSQIKKCVPLAEADTELLERDFWMVSWFSRSLQIPGEAAALAARSIRARRDVPIEYVVASTYVCRLKDRAPAEAWGGFPNEIAMAMARQSLPEVIAIANDDSRDRELRNQAIELIATMKPETAATALNQVYGMADAKSTAWIAEAIVRQQSPKPQLRELLTKLADDERLSAESRDAIGKRLKETKR
jgi:hypothetical protein